jgi:hypothetical protein
MFGELKNINIRTKNKMVEKNINLFKELGPVNKENIYLKCGRPRQEYNLNEAQKLFLIFLLGNTEQTINIKFKITKLLNRMED